MSLPILQYTHKTQVAGAAGLLDEIQSFAVQQGWSLYTIIRNCSWDEITAGSYNWSSGDETYMQLTSSGYGSQLLGYEFRLDPYDSTTAMIEWAMYDRNNDTPLTTSALHPIEQVAAARNNYPASGAVCHWFSFPAGVFPELWIFGDERFVLAVARVSESSFICVSFGTLVLAEEYWSRTDLGFWWPVQRYALGNEETRSWETIADYLEDWQAPFVYSQGNETDCTANTCDYDGSWRAAHIASSGEEYEAGDFGPYYDDISQVWSTHGRFAYPRYGCGYNDWTEKYVPIATRHFVSDGTSFRPVGMAPIMWIPWTGDLEAGETVYFGLERFLAFPVHIATSSYGFLVRIY
jgi:hypothetical protein